ncbi:serine/threonine-protein kinase [Polyangium spumosum]|uniref:non-specific serine/threonine protein kinase n=1 Tax=Polyangium spumosum TaxID=889282 RepID=A0A6N7PPE9_9BACT|nr:serine/threonine-protein kinase [Polyangium spumosum]MRG92210.1 protein kinase [Polyangium spumosum]
MSMPIAIGDVIADKYRVDRLLGSGGMGVVVAATHLELRTRRAIKVMLSHVVASPLCVERFLREARTLSELRSAHVARVYDVGRLPNDAPFMVMEYLEGHTLMARLSRYGPLPVEEAATHALHACEALAEAHARGIVHRDLKPENLFLTEASDGSPCVKVLDFGVSKLLHEEGPTRTSTGAIVGSPLYMSPEQVNAARDVDARSDIWAMGIILFQLVTGECPFRGNNVLQILAQLANKNPTPPSALRRDLPPALDAVILRCLQKDRDERYQDVVALARDLAPLAVSAPGAVAETVARIERIQATAARTAAMSTATSLGVDPGATTDPGQAFARTEAEARMQGADLDLDLAVTPPPWTRAGIETTLRTGSAMPPPPPRDATETTTAIPRRNAARNFAAGALLLALCMPLGGILYRLAPGANAAASPVPTASPWTPPPPAGNVAGVPAPDEPPKEPPKLATASASAEVAPRSTPSTRPAATTRVLSPRVSATPKPPPRY